MLTMEVGACVFTLQDQSLFIVPSFLSAPGKCRRLTVRKSIIDKNQGFQACISKVVTLGLGDFSRVSRGLHGLIQVLFWGQHWGNRLGIRQ